MGTKTNEKIKVFLVTADESASGKHEVYFAPDGDLNRVKSRKFEFYGHAVGYAEDMGEKHKVLTYISGYGGYRTRKIDYSKQEQIKSKPKKISSDSRRIKSKPVRITRKPPKIR